MISSQRALQTWTFIHRWTSLISTVFLLLLCISGLPLVFSEEIGFHPEVEEVAPGTPPASLDQIVAAVRAARPNERLPFMFFDEEEPLVMAATAPSLRAPPDDFYFQIFDLRTGSKLEMPQPKDTFLYYIARLHIDLFAGLPGKLFLGVMALLLVAAIVSGVVLYAPFMRKLDFGTVRTDRSARVRWLDLHNLLGIVTVGWLSVVGLTGTINTLAEPIEEIWQAKRLGAMIEPYRNIPPPSEFTSADAAVSTALDAVPEMELRTIAFPGTAFAGDHHYGIYVAGNTAVTSRLLKPVLVDAATGEVTAVSEMPWYVKTLFLSQPLHFGDYGGLPLKFIWALLDIVTIIVLASGLYLYCRRPRRVTIRSDDPTANPISPNGALRRDL